MCVTVTAEGHGLARTPPLPDRVARVLRERILAADLRPGTFLRLDQIADELGVSPTPVREALAALRADDMVLALPRRGFVVAPLHRADLVDLFEVEARLTAELAARAARRVDDSGAALLTRLTRDVEARSADADAAGDDPGGDPGDALHHDRPDGLVDAERALHVALNRIAGSRKLAWLAGRTANYVPRTFYTRSHAWRTSATGAHRVLLDAVTTGDPERARAAMTTHVLDSRDLLLAHLDTVGLWSPEETAPHDPEETPCP